MLKKTALSCAASPFTTVPQRDCHLQPSSHNPHNPNSTCQPLPFPLAPPLLRALPNRFPPPAVTVQPSRTGVPVVWVKREQLLEVGDF
ncbi:hypothetical protein CEB43_04835, partial [Klebsiella pneumoniae subsp. pneumoniae]